jgi:Ca2+-binding RTX toxin-like protein
MAKTIKLDANFHDEPIDLAALGYADYDVVKVTIKGYYRDDGQGKDDYRDVQLVYGGDIDVPLKSQRVLFLDDGLSLTLFNEDPVLGGNKDPNKDFRVVLEAGLYSDADNIVHFDDLSPMQRLAIRDGAPLYNAGGGDDHVILPGKGEFKMFDSDRVFTSGAGNDTVFGGNRDDKLDGGSGVNWLLGGGGNDWLFSHEIGDSLDGGGGRDAIIGNGGGDYIAGNGGADRFIYKKFSDSPDDLSNYDSISDFSHAEGDRFDLSAIDAIPGGRNQKFTWIGTDDFSKKGGELRYVTESGYTFIQASGRSDDAKLEIRLYGEFDLVKGDFLL